MAINKLINWILFLLLSIIWGSSFILMKHSKEELSASQIAALRIFSAGLVFLPFATVEISSEDEPLPAMEQPLGDVLAKNGAGSEDTQSAA